MSHTQRAEQHHVARFPALVSTSGSLTPMEKSLLGHFILLAQPKVLVELGVFKAVTTEFICKFLSENSIDAKLVGFDLLPVVEQLRRENSSVAHFELTNRLQLIPGALPESLQQWLSNSNAVVDFALVDATHDYRSVLSEVRLLWSKLSPNGYILCHDYSSKYDGVRYAVHRFARSHDAMVLPLTSSAAASCAGNGSVLVALCRRPFEPKVGRFLRHLWSKTKSDLLAHHGVNKVWQKWLKPLVRRESE